MSTDSRFLQISVFSVNQWLNPAILTPQILKEPDDALNPTIEVRDVELLIGRVQIVVGQAKAHHHARNFEYVLEIGHNGNGPAGADENRIFFENIRSASVAALIKRLS